METGLEYGAVSSERIQVHEMKHSKDMIRILGYSFHLHDFEGFPGENVPQCWRMISLTRINWTW
jgi:hypothetical protein